MPFILSKVNVPLTVEQQALLTSGLGRAIEFIPGKTAASLMTGFEADAHLYLRGDNSKPMAYITVAVFANPEQCGYGQLSHAITRLFQNTLGIEADRIYIKYEDIPAWSVAGQLFSETVKRT